MSAAPTMKRRRFSTGTPGGGPRRAYEKPPARARRASRVVPHPIRQGARRAERHAAAGGADEGEQMIDVGRADLGLDAGDGGTEVGADPEEDAKGGGERSDPLGVEAGPREPD